MDAMVFLYSWCGLTIIAEMLTIKDWAFKAKAKAWRIKAKAKDVLRYVQTVLVNKDSLQGHGQCHGTKLLRRQGQG